ncbi:hypothetical protein ROHU_029471 [Labeo rohita]|uniref:Uncharacterized protein n=1 Tax=Labeo rohita TaxID=84645 RepID=A0A498LWV5_LABRO|nr:hypothetical protein ROHU_029471 [Labeo rohita]
MQVYCVIRSIAGEQSSTSTSTDKRPSDLRTAALEMEAIRDVHGDSSTSSSSEGTSSSAESRPSDVKTNRGCTSTSAVSVSSSEESEKINLLAKLQAAAILEG